MSRSTNGRKPAFEQFAAARRYQPTLAISPDGAEVAYSTNISGQYNIWRQAIGGGYAYQVTSYTDDAVRDVSWSPDGETLLFLADHHGNEQYQLHTIAPRDGWPELIPGEPDVQHFLGPWSPDGNAFAYAANDREPTEQDILLRNQESGEIKRIVTGDNYFPGVWSPDGRYLSVLRFMSNTDTEIQLYDTTDESVKPIFPEHLEETRYAPGPWAPDGSGFYLASDEGREFVGIAFYTLATGEQTWVETPDWDIETFELSKDGKTFVWVVNENGYSRLYAKNPVTGAAITVPPIPDGVSGALQLSHDGRYVALLINSATHSTEAYSVDLVAQQVTRLTEGFLGGVPESSMVAPEQITFKSFDDRDIPALLYRPRGEGPFPVVFSIHGGPEAQERPSYVYGGLYQYLLSRGIGVLATNIRGSSGYGKSYQKLIHRDFGGDDLKDFEAAAKFLQSLPWVDGNRLGLFGGSYGGFAVLSCVSRLPDYWAAAVDIVGPSNLVTFTKAVPPTWRRFMAKWCGDPYTEEEFLLSRSPITYVDQITAPLFVIQGANDPRVVKAESDQIVERLRARGVDVRYDVYDDEGHGFTKRANELKAMKDSAEFLESHLAG